VIVRAVPNAAASGLLEAPDDQAARMAAQATRFGPADLVRLADVVDEGITAMKGATPTRLQLELVCARLLLPGAGGSAPAFQSRLERLERRLALDAAVPVAADEPIPGQKPTPDPEPTPEAEPTAPVERPATTQDAPPTVTAPDRTADVRRLWPEVLVRLREIKRTPWSLISQQAAVIEVSDGVLTLAFNQPSLRDTFMRRDDFQANLRQAITDVLGIDLRVEAIVDPAAPAAKPAVVEQRRVPRPDPEQPAHPDDPDHADARLSERELLERTLGARVIEEIEHG
jgi:DNA polymerase-3 subunit gamma/tau